MKLIAGTRGSKLAIRQTDIVIEKLKEVCPNLVVEKKIITTKGDRILDRALDKIGDKGIFVNEIESRLLSGEIDFAVHSLKDMPSKIADGLKITKSVKRETANDILIVNQKYDLKQEDIISWFRKSKGLKVGTGSKRRRVQLLEMNPTCVPMLIRGNIDTRISKLISEDLDAIVLAAAGIKRLGLDIENSACLPYDKMIPAAGQGALAIEIREDNELIEGMIQKIYDEKTEIETICERSFLSEINGGCHIPVGAVASINGNRIVLRAIYGDEDCNKVVKGFMEGDIDEAYMLGKMLAAKLKKEII